MSFFDIDENRWPIVIITLSGKETKQDIREIFAKLDNYQARDESFCFVLDLREMKHLSPEAREQLVSLLKHTDMHELAGTAMVVSSPLMRVYLSLLFWITGTLDRRRSHYKYKTAFSLNEAYEWSRNRLDIRKPGSNRFNK